MSIKDDFCLMWEEDLGRQEARQTRDDSIRTVLDKIEEVLLVAADWAEDRQVPFADGLRMVAKRHIHPYRAGESNEPWWLSIPFDSTPTRQCVPLSVFSLLEEGKPKNKKHPWRDYEKASYAYWDLARAVWKERTEGHNRMRTDL